jgi:hypothetical protein
MKRNSLLYIVLILVFGTLALSLSGRLLEAKSKPTNLIACCADITEDRAGP